MSVPAPGSVPFPTPVPFPAPASFPAPAPLPSSAHPAVPHYPDLPGAATAATVPAVPAPPRAPRPVGTDAPATCEVPHFDPVRVRGASHRLGRLLRHRRRALAAGLAVTAAALVAAGPRAATDPLRAERPRKHPLALPVRRHAPPVEMVSAPVRIADAATVRLLRPGDRVDVVAAGDPARSGEAWVIARGVRVTELPQPVEGAAESGALVVLSVPRSAAARLVGASATARLAVTLC
ncbi:hypothetical protein [Streptomyces sp. NPDC093970]|uniref:hypothetical protein n=1 Tax=Streptomyces sp. NPDC093970 TaxID=3155076 RepID=UPI0034488336